VEVGQQVGPRADQGGHALGCCPAHLPAHIVIVTVLVLTLWGRNKTHMEPLSPQTGVLRAGGAGTGRNATHPLNIVC
jgi:hypothetical protein